jgi:hypothetical protein
LRAKKTEQGSPRQTSQQGQVPFAVNIWQPAACSGRTPKDKEFSAHGQKRHNVENKKRAATCGKDVAQTKEQTQTRNKGT